MSKQTEALKLALEALESCDEGDWSTGHVIHPSYDEDAVKQAMIAIEEALAQPEQEPVAFLTNRRQRLNVEFNATGLTLMPKSVDWKIPLYTTPPQRKWVGLTDEDKKEYVAQDFGGNRLDAMDWAEKRLKEKNT